jgi:hypothetical protein
MDVQISRCGDLRSIVEGAVRPGVWVGDGVAHLGLTGDVDPADWDALSDLVTDDEDQADERAPMPWETAKYSAEGRAIVERLRRDGLL